LRLNGLKCFSNKRVVNCDTLDIDFELDADRNPMLEPKRVAKLTSYGNHVLASMFLPDKMSNSTSNSKNAQPVLYEDDYLAVVYKPSGIHTLPWEGVRDQFTFKDILPLVLQAPHPQVMQADADTSLPGPLPCHRLDSRVQGVVIVAKTVRTLATINGMFASGGKGKQVEKWYQAVLQGEPSTNFVTKVVEEDDEYLVDIPLLKGDDGRRHGGGNDCSNSDRGQPKFPCLTRLRILKTVTTGAHLRTTVALSPITGRRHQLRRHCAALGSPILGDSLYYDAHTDDAGGKVRGGRLWLRAVSVTLPHPSPSRVGQVVHCCIDGFA
jgi:23S rRNA-/tRNA-specific pseudouridylate synthase